MMIYVIAYVCALWTVITSFALVLNFDPDMATLKPSSIKLARASIIHEWSRWPSN